MDSSSSIIVRFFVSILNLYQKAFSPHLGKHCIYFPSCSEYAKQAFLKFGFLKGFLLSFFRLFRCVGLFFTGGIDLVPKTFSFKNLFKPYQIFWKKRS